ncbi:hypothetical protein [Pandoraea sp. NPDC087047]|uniref:hypothetical protein n=1 Tax=Pandoraea sp. NPDC087047 TaxID=3364390 RepID=UPI0037F98DC9
MLVANLAAPAASMIPRRARHPDLDNEADTAVTTPLGPETLPDANAPASSAFNHVVVRPVAHSPVRSEYTFHEFLKAVSTARAPFRYLGESMGDAYEVLSGQTVDPHVRLGVRKAGEALDVATEQLPYVSLLRLPGNLADIAEDEVEGKTPDAEEVAGLLQYGDPRSLGSAQPLDADSPPVRSPVAYRPVAESLPTHHGDASHPAPDADSLSREAPGVVAPDAPDGERDEGSDGMQAPPAPPVAGASAPLRASQSHIVDEDEYLRGYEQSLPADQLPAGEPSRLVLVNGHHYLKGDAGYYRAQRGLSADHWLVDAPQSSDRRAQVPVTYDESTGEWRAHAPLKLCGGGCGLSKHRYPPDSIVNSFEDISSAIDHIPDDTAQEAIQVAFLTLGKLHLRRTNRADLQSLRDNSIINHRAALRAVMASRIDPNLPLIKQQCLASEITSMYYAWNTAAEAFCQENAEILFFSLRQNGLSRSQIRMITIKPHNRPAHVMVLYTDSKHLIELMDRSTPKQPQLHPDGISHEFFLGAIYLTRDSTVLMDPWSQTKAISFTNAASTSDVGSMINRALIDIGHQPGHPYTVSVTRPLGTYRTSPSSVSSGSSSGNFASGPLNRGGSVSSGDTASSDAGAPAASG